MKYIIVILSLLASVVVFGADAEQKISGVVRDASTEMPIEGATVLIRAKNNVRAVTDREGKFETKFIGSDAQMEVNYPGYKRDLCFVGKQASINIYLKADDMSSFEDNIVMPFSVKPLNEVTVSAAQIVLDRSMIDGVESLEQLLQSRIAGLNVRMNSGMPAEGASMMIRGRRSINASSYPLLVIDGVVVENSYADEADLGGYYANALRNIDINDVERVTVLKSGSAIYGAKGSAGVVIIETHRPKDVKTTVQATANFGVNLAPKAIPMMNGYQHKQYLFEQMQLSGLNVADIQTKYPWMASDPSYPYTTRYNNNTLWQDEVFKNSFTHNYHLMVKGGDAVAKYAFSLGYLSHSATANSADFERYNTRLNADLKIAKRLNLQANIAYSVANSDMVDDTRRFKTSQIGSALIKSPLFHPNIIDHKDIVYPRFDDIDPLGVANPAVLADKVDNKLMTNDFRASAKLIYEITRELNVSHTIGVIYSKMRGNRFVPLYGVGGLEFGDRMSSRYIDEYSGLFNDTRVNWNKQFNVVHNVSLHAGVRVYTNSKQIDNSRDYGLANDEFKTSSTDAASTSNINKKFVNGVNNVWNSVSAYLQGGYDYRDLVYLTAGIANEASSKFSKNNRWQYFPSVSGAIRLTSLQGLKNSHWLNELKLRASWDMSGNDDIGSLTSRAYSISTMYRDFGGIIIANKDNNVKNELTSEFGVGLDLAAFNNRLILSADYYNSKTTNVLICSLSDDTYGSMPTYSNSAQLSDRGWEFAANGRLINNRDMKWDLGVNISLPHATISSQKGNSIVSMYGGDLAYINGEAPCSFYGYRAEGVFSTSAQAQQANLVDRKGKPFVAGDMRYADITPDGIIDSKDMMVIGNPLPEFYGGLNTKIAYKRFTLSAVVDFTYGNDVFNYVRMMAESMNDFSNQSTAVLRRWSQEGQQTDIPRAVNGQHANSAFSSRWIEDGSFLRLSNVTLSYDINFNRHLRSLRIYISANNLLTSTKYLGYDPEVGLGGVDYGKIPVSKGVLLGVKIGF